MTRRRIRRAMAAASCTARTASGAGAVALPAVTAACGLGLLLLATGVAAARPGGGDSFSGGGGHSSGGSGSSGGGGAVVFELIYWLFRLIFWYPSVGLPLVAIVVGYFLYSSFHQRRNKDWDSGPPVEVHETVDLADLRRLDPAFSQVVFEDFAFRLFSTAQRARHPAEQLATIAPYVSEAARAALAARAPVGQPVGQVVVGAMRVYRLELPDALPAASPGAAPDEPGDASPAAHSTAPGAPGSGPGRVRIGIEYEANIATAEHTYYTVENWLFGRDATVHSKPPSAARTFPCPNCGAPWQAARTGTQVCANCGQAVDNGRFDWVVEQVELRSSDERPPTLTTEVPERGTDLPTYRQPDVDAAWIQLTRDDPQVSDDALDARLTMIYSQLNFAWSSNELKPVRGLVSDGLYDYLSYWVDAYRQQGLRNALTDMRITHTALARVTRDRYYDAVTIRLWATGKDYVVRGETGAVVRGSKHHERPYSEYWTLIRSASRKGAPLATPSCGNCGAPLHVTQSGECDHCGAHVTSGEFDWVISKIEQDDTYRG